MAKPIISATGIEVQTFEEIFDELVEAYKDIYGSDIVLDQDTPDGQRIGIESKLSLDLQSSALALYNSFDPDFAVGNQINKISKIAGITRRPATKSIADVEIVTTQTVDLLEDYTITDTLGQNWIINEAQTLNIGTHLIGFEAEEYGAVEASANTITEFDTVVLGVESVTNPISAYAGVDEETDEEFRIRRNESTENPSYSTVGGLYAKLYNTLNVTGVKVYENEEDDYDAEKDMVGHSLWVVVDGGTIEDITEQIVKQKSSGTTLKGDTIGSYTEVLVLDDGTTRSLLLKAKFDRPAITNVYINLTVTPKVSTESIDIDQIKSGLAKKIFSINENVTVTELYAYVYSNVNNFIATGLEVSKDNVTFVGTEIEAGYDEKFFIDVLNINITEV